MIENTQVHWKISSDTAKNKNKKKNRKTVLFVELCLWSAHKNKHAAQPVQFYELEVLKSYQTINE